MSRLCAFSSVWSFLLSHCTFRALASCRAAGGLFRCSRLWCPAAPPTSSVTNWEHDFFLLQQSPGQLPPRTPRPPASTPPSSSAAPQPKLTIPPTPYHGPRRCLWHPRSRPGKGRPLRRQRSTSTRIRRERQQRSHLCRATLLRSHFYLAIHYPLVDPDAKPLTTQTLRLSEGNDQAGCVGSHWQATAAQCQEKRRAERGAGAAGGEEGLREGS